MAQLGFLEFVVRDASGNVVSGASVEVRAQGAYIQSGGPTSFTVDAPGAIVATNSTQVNTGGPTRTVSSITATNVTVGGAGFTGTSDDDRITVVTPLPTIYNDAAGNETKTNALTTDSAGYAFCYVVGGKYDVLVSGTGLTTKLYKDVVAGGGEHDRSNIVGGAGPAFILDTLRVLSANDKILSIREAGVEKASVDDDGDTAVNNATVAGTLAVTGAATLSSTLAAGATTVTGRITGSEHIVLTDSAYFKHLNATAETDLATSDFAISAGWGDTATKDNAFGGDTSGRFLVTCNGSGIAANPTVTLTFKRVFDSNTVQSVVVRHDISAPTTAWWAQTTISTTAVTWTFVGTPVAGTQYIFGWHIMGGT